jgi:hypothetical protein
VDESTERIPRKTGWRLRGGKRTLWGALTFHTAVFRIVKGSQIATPVLNSGIA